MRTIEHNAILMNEKNSILKNVYSKNIIYMLYIIVIIIQKNPLGEFDKLNCKFNCKKNNDLFNKLCW